MCLLIGEDSSGTETMDTYRLTDIEIDDFELAFSSSGINYSEQIVGKKLVESDAVMPYFDIFVCESAQNIYQCVIYQPPDLEVKVDGYPRLGSLDIAKGYFIDSAQTT